MHWTHILYKRLCNGKQFFKLFWFCQKSNQEILSLNKISKTEREKVFVLFHYSYFWIFMTWYFTQLLILYVEIWSIMKCNEWMILEEVKASSFLGRLRWFRYRMREISTSVNIQDRRKKVWWWQLLNLKEKHPCFKRISIIFLSDGVNATAAKEVAGLPN